MEEACKSCKSISASSLSSPSAPLSRAYETKSETLTFVEGFSTADQLVFKGYIQSTPEFQVHVL